MVWPKDRRLRCFVLLLCCRQWSVRRIPIEKKRFYNQINGPANSIGIIPEGSISTWLLTRRKEMVMPKPEWREHSFFPISRVNNHVDMDTEDFIPFIISYENYCWNLEISMAAVAGKYQKWYFSGDIALHIALTM